MATLCLRSIVFSYKKSKSVIRRGNSSLACEMRGCTGSLVQTALKVSSSFPNQVRRSQADLTASPTRCNLRAMPQSLALPEPLSFTTKLSAKNFIFHHHHACTFLVVSWLQITGVRALQPVKVKKLFAKQKSNVFKQNELE